MTPLGTKLLIGTPSGENIIAMTMGCLDRVKLRHMCYVANLIGIYVERNQNLIIEQALSFPSVEHIMFIDSDMMFPDNIVETLMARNKDIVGCAYRTRQPPHGFAVRMHGNTMATGQEVGLVDVNFIPSGMMLVRRRVFEKMPFPWFFNTYGEKTGDFVGNDVNFCHKAQALGFKTYCDFLASREIVHFGGCAIGFRGIA